MPSPVRPRKLRREIALRCVSMGFKAMRLLIGFDMGGQDVPSTDWDYKSEPRGSWSIDEFVEVDERGAEHGVGGLFRGTGKRLCIGFASGETFEVAGEGFF